MIPLYLIKVLCIVGIHKHVRPWLAFGVHAALSLKHKRSRPTTFGVWAERQAQRERKVVGEGNGEMKRSRGSKQRHLRRTHTHTHTHTCAQTQTQTQTQTHTHTDTQTHTHRHTPWFATLTLNRHVLRWMPPCHAQQR